VNVIVPAGVQSRRLPREVMSAYRGPFAERASREPTHVFPREIPRSHDCLATVQKGLVRLEDLPVLLLWGARDPAFREAERRRFERAFPKHRTVVLGDAGHFIQEDAAKEIVEEISGWA
jgi:haloalkane dehalogenase